MAERVYTIPVNYDEGKLKLLGYFSVRTLIESLIFTAIVGSVVYFICSLFGQKLLGGILLVVLFIIFTVVGSFAFGSKTMGQMLLQLIGFGKAKKILKFRRIRKRLSVAKKKR